MSPVVMVVRDVIREEPLEMALVQRNDLVEQLAPATADPALRDSILPRALDRGLHATNCHGSNRSRYFQSVLCVVIEDEELGHGLIGKCVAQLLHNPTARWMTSDIEVQDAATVMADDEKAVEHTERERRDREEIHRCDGFAVIAKKRQPAVGGFWAPGCSPHPAGDARLRYLEAQHEEFAMDARCTPSWILRDHLEDQVTDLFGDSTATADSFSHSAEHGPIQFEPSLVPSHHGLWEDENERFFPVGPETARHDPEEFIEWTQSGSRVLAFQDGELLAKGEILEQQAAVGAKNAKNGSEPEPKEV